MAMQEARASADTELLLCEWVTVIAAALGRGMCLVISSRSSGVMIMVAAWQLAFLGSLHGLQPGRAGG